MNHISPKIYELKEVTSLKLSQLDLGKASQWYGYMVTKISLIPSHMQTNPHVAAGVIASSNLIFFFVIGAMISYMDKRLEKKDLKDDQRFIKNIFLNGIVLGGSVLGFNSFLSNTTQYPLAKSSVAALIVVTIACRTIIHKLSKCFTKNAATGEKKSVHLKTHQLIRPKKLKKTKKNQKIEVLLNNQAVLKTKQEEQEKLDEQEKIKKLSEESEAKKTEGEPETPQLPSSPKNVEAENEKIEKNIQVNFQDNETEALAKEESTQENTQEPLKVENFSPATDCLPPISDKNHELELPNASRAEKIVKNKPKQKKLLNVEKFILKFGSKNKRGALHGKHKGRSRFVKSPFKQSLSLSPSFAKPFSNDVNLLFKSSRFKNRFPKTSMQSKNVNSMVSPFWPKLEPIANPLQQNLNPFFKSSVPKARARIISPQKNHLSSFLSYFWPKNGGTEKPSQQNKVELDDFLNWAYI